MSVRAVLYACAAVLLALTAVAALSPNADAASSTLTRAPYLTDATATSVRVNWATPSGGSANAISWGPAGSRCDQFTATGTSSPFTVVSTVETMWSARLGNLAPQTTYCYQILSGGASVLGAPITFRTLPAAGSTSGFSFDVIGDTGYNGDGGTNPDQDRLYALMAKSGAAFTLFSGDLAYNNGSQTNYGDLTQTGANVSAVFGPAGWPVAGGSTPAFPVLGNHGRIATFLQNWPAADAVSNSGGTFSMINYPGQAGADTASYPTAYYAFNVGQARFYVLDADWTNGNVGTSSLYGQDYLNHWAPGTAQYEWLKADLAAHPGGLKFATFHFPLHSDNATESSDTYLQGADALEGLLAANGVAMVFNGHAHMYERNRPVVGNLVSYITGGGGGVLEPTGGLGCTNVDAYSIGWSPTSNSGSRCGAASAPTSPSQVYHFLHVTVSGSTVSVAPTNALGQVFDPVTYQIPTAPPPVSTTFSPAADTYLYAGAPSATYGTADPLLVSAGSYRGLVRFDTRSLAPSASITGVTLRTYSTVGLPSGGLQVHPASTAWGEASTSWANQPAWNATVLGRSGTPTAPGWLSIELPTSSITPGGDSAFGLDYSVSGIIERLASREDASNPPQLIVTTAPVPVTTAVTASEDSFVYGGTPSATNGTTTPLLCSAGSYRALVRFDTSWLRAGAQVSGVTLRLYATVGLGSGGVRVHPEASGWNEATVNWSNQPTWNTEVLGTSATATAPGWVSIDLPTYAVTPGGTTDFGLDYSVSQMIERIASREDAAHAPQLVITAI